MPSHLPPRPHSVGGLRPTNHPVANALMTAKISNFTKPKPLNAVPSKRSKTPQPDSRPKTSHEASRSKTPESKQRPEGSRRSGPREETRSRSSSRQRFDVSKLAASNATAAQNLPKHPIKALPKVVPKLKGQKKERISLLFHSFSIFLFLNTLMCCRKYHLLTSGAWMHQRRLV